MNKRETHIMQGMTRDLSVARFNPNLVVDARNIRITTLKNNSTLLSVTNEKGTSEFTLSTYPEGTIIGTAVIKNHLVLFTTQNGMDRIYSITFNESDYSYGTVGLIYGGNLGFDVKHPIETLAIYENEELQKVYWVDGINQPRVVNIAGSAVSNGDVFNFNRKIEGKHSMEVIKYNTGGEFPAGTVQYCFNYFNKFGQETNIVDTSALYYLSPKDKGLPADAMSTSSFVVRLSGLDSNFEYVRLYSIVRTSENAVPNVRIVGDYKISLQLTTSREDQASDIITSKDKLYWVSSDLSERILFSDYYTGEWNSGTPTSIDIGDGYIYDEATDKYYALYYLSTETPTKIGGIVIFKNGATYNILSNPMPYYSRAGLMTMHKGETKGITVVDNGIVGSTLDASALLFIGGQKLTADTITNKDSTLFLGNIKQTVPNIGELKVGNTNVKSAIRGKAQSCIFDFFGNEKDIEDDPTLEDYNYVSGKSFYSYPIDNNKSSYDTKSFKARENYRLGFIAQYYTGQWSEALWIDDLDEQFAPGRMVFYTDSQRENNKHYGASYRKPGFKAIIPQTIISTLKNAGFVRIAPVVVYPNDAERKVLYQGLLASTVYNVDDRDNNSPFVQADWRFRVGYKDTGINGEIQANTYGAVPNYPVAVHNSETLDADEFIADYANQYYRDSSILTFHSPDIEENENLISGTLEDVKLRIVGISTLNFEDAEREGYYKLVEPKITADSFVEVSSQGFNNEYSRVLPFSSFQENEDINPRDHTQRSASIEDLAFAGFADNAVYEKTADGEEGIIAPIGGTEHHNIIFRWITYLWHRSGSLNNQKSLSEAAHRIGSIRYAVLSKKCISEIRYARTVFFQTKNTFGPDHINIDINTPRIFNSTQTGAVKIDGYGRKGLIYYGNVDKAIVPTFKSVLGITCPVDNSSPANLNSKGYPTEYESYTDYSTDDTSRTNNSSGRPSRQGGSGRSPISRNDGEDIRETMTLVGGEFWAKDPVLMRYKSTKHLVFGLTAQSETFINTLAESALNPAYPAFWRDNELVTHNDALAGLLNDYSHFIDFRNCVYVAELYRDFTPEQLAARFGGTSDDALANNTWVRCGDSVYLTGGSATLYYKEGDTYVGRYDCMKTYPFSNEDPNQIVSIYSTELESRVNLDERYDKDRGDTSNVLRNPTNFNLYNHPGYEQTNQYFTYKALDYSKIMLNHPNMLTWSLEKKMGADIDAWTSIPLTSTADAQGDLGEITSLETFNDNIYLFQPRGVAQVLFNERVQIPTSDGQPIEITNGLKYGGLRYLSNQIGMTNKWSLATTPRGMYFIDDEKNVLYQFNGQQFSDLSTKLGFNTWLASNNSYNVWNPSDYKNIRTFYDKVREDLYFVTADDALVFSEKLNTFVSFYDYNALPVLVNMNDRLITFRKSSVNNLNMAWELFGGKFNSFFGTYKPYWLTFISNADPTYDKVFNSLAWRSTDYADVTKDFQGELAPLSTFDTLRVWNDHQDTGLVDLTDTPGKPSPIKKKFNVFRALVPRDKEGDYKGKGMNRIRNPWTYIQLSRTKENEDMLIFHDLDVDYFI